MFNYIRSDQLTKKPVTTKPITPAAPMTPIEMEVNMPIEMQQIPQPGTNETCIYPDMNIPPLAAPQPLPVPTMPTTPSPSPCSNCPHCTHYTMCKPPMPMPKPPTMPNIPLPTPPKPDPSCDMSKNQDDMEVAYMKKMYPPLCQKIQKYVEAELNQYDHDLSPIYEMYPSTETINHMANCIYTDMKASMGNLIKQFEGHPNTRSPIGGSFYTLVYALLLNELYRKRMRRRLYR